MGYKRVPLPPANTIPFISLLFINHNTVRKTTFNSLCNPFCSLYRGQKPSLPLKMEFFLPLRLSCKESSTFSPSPSSSGSGDVTALQCSEPLRSKVGGPSKVFARFCGMGPLGEKNKYLERQVIDGKSPYLLFRNLHIL